MRRITLAVRTSRYAVASRLGDVVAESASAPHCGKRRWLPRGRTALRHCEETFPIELRGGELPDSVAQQAQR